MNKRRKKKYITEDEVEKLKAVCVTFSDQLIVYGLLYTGMRVDELCHMHPGWINTRKATITIPEEENGWHPKIVKLVDKQTGQVMKEYHSNRVIPVLNPTLAKILASMVQNNYRHDTTPHKVWVRLNHLGVIPRVNGNIQFMELAVDHPQIVKDFGFK